MITTELIARAICQYGTCKVCDPDCVDYRAAQRVVKALEGESPAELLKSAEANAVNNFELDADKLYVADAYASQGPILKRMQPVSRGRGNRINKRTSHITVVVKERV